MEPLLWHCTPYSVVRKGGLLLREPGELLGVLHNARCDACDGCNALL